MPLLLVRNDITKMTVDAIVNAANPSLLGGGGVDGAIHRAAGPELLAECRTLGGCRTGEAKITGAYRLHAKYVIHTVGPIWRGGQNGEEHLLRSCYRRSLELAAEHGCETVAFPLISSGVYGYPKADAFRVAAEAVDAFLKDHDLTVYLVLFDRAAYLLGDRFGAIRCFIDDAYAEAEARKPENQKNARWAKEPRDVMADTGKIYREEACLCAPSAAPAPKKPKNLMSERKDEDRQDLLRRLDEGFSATLLKLIDEKGLTDVQCYKKANVDRKLFSKIRSDPRYKPSKTTAVAFALALELTFPETQQLLARAGFTLSHSFLFDIIVEACIEKGVFNVLDVNEILFSYDQPLLGS
ncbi:MAG: O-acetyl-ADP-ribose deacetylase [Clostridia bacterium]|nr:O-acetyl-ADP-ribose deacetylase [Clostridia bacterium]